MDFVDISVRGSPAGDQALQDIAAVDLSIDPVELDLDYGDYGEILDWLSGVDLLCVTLDNPGDSGGFRWPSAHGGGQN